MDYHNLMSSYIQANSSIANCMQQQHQSHRTTQAPHTAFDILGAEGAGHHAISSMDGSYFCSIGFNKSISGGCSGSGSFPSFGNWRRGHNIPPTKFMTPCSTILRQYDKYMVILRDPVDTFSSTLRRFWKLRHETDTLLGELQAHYEGWKHLSACVRQLPCDRTIFISYELLTSFPDTHASALSTFLGVHAADPKLRAWLQSLHGPGTTREVATKAVRAPASGWLPCKISTDLLWKLRNISGTWAHTKGEIVLPEQEWVNIERPASLVPYKGQLPSWAEQCRGGSDGDCLMAWRSSIRSWFDEHRLDVFPASHQTSDDC
uniref:Sulfotransferase domain-containing protein n=1 Tax=Chrysotila carterae TaxID=13221 RepID=A0A7S4FA32_CHRCT